VTEASLCKEICRVQNEQTLSPQAAASNVDTPTITNKAEHGHMLLTMSLQPSFKTSLEDRHGTSLPEQNDTVWPASIGGILLMLTPLLIL